MEPIEKLLKALSLQPSSSAAAAASSVYMGGGGDYQDHHANAISRLIEERRKSLEDKNLVRKLECKERILREIKNCWGEKIQEQFRKKYIVASYVEESVQDMEPEDKIKFLNIGMDWRNALLYERIELFFPLVVAIVTFEKYVKLGDLLNCRLVCKGWKQGVDKLLEQAYKDIIDRNDSKKYSVLEPSNFAFLTPQKLQDFFKAFPRELECKPIVSRFVVVNDTTPQRCMIDQFWIRMMFLIGGYGKDIWRLRVVLNTSLLKMGKIHFPLLSLLSEQTVQVLNDLKHLELHANDVLSFCRHPDIQLITEAVRKRTFKALPSLETLAIWQFPIEAASPLVRLHKSTLKNLSLRFNMGDSLDILNLGRFPKLEFLAVSSMLMGGKVKVLPMTCKDDFPALEEIHLEYSGVAPQDVLNIVKNVNLIGKNKLRYLYLSFVKGFGAKVKFVEKDLPSLWLHLPKLERLDFSVDRVNLKNIDFLLPLGSLKEFRLAYLTFKEKKQAAKSAEEPTSAGSSTSATAGPKNDDRGAAAASSKSTSSSTSTTTPGEIIKYTGYANRMYESNIWDLLPELRKLEITVVRERRTSAEFGQAAFLSKGQVSDDWSVTTRKVYSREGFIKYREQKK